MSAVKAVAVMFTNLIISHQLHFCKNTSLCVCIACANHNLYIMFLSVPESCTRQCRDWTASCCLTLAWANRIAGGVGCLIHPQQNSCHEFTLLLSLDKSILHHIARYADNNKSRSFSLLLTREPSLS